MSIPRGRCAADGEAGPLRAVEAHVLTCPGWAKLYREEPSRALDPAAEFARWSGQDKEREHAEDLAARTADTVSGRAATRQRFATVDLLED